MIDGLYEGIYKGRNKFGFEKDKIYNVKIVNSKKRGYGLMAIYNVSDDTSCQLFCPYSSETSIRSDWRFQECQN